MSFSISRAITMAKRNFLQLKRDPAKLIHVFYWSFLDIILWGYSASWVQKDSLSDVIGISLLMGVIFWQFVVRSNFDISLGVIEEVLSHNITNLFASPLSVYEWLVGLLMVSVVICSLLLLFCHIIAFYVYKMSIFAIFGWTLPIFIILLYLSGTSFGLLAGTLILIGGARFQSLVYMIGWGFAPLGGIFYPINVLPQWVQFIASWFPLMYIFDAVRKYIETNQLVWNFIYKAFALNIIYVILSAIIFMTAFKYSRNRGLSRLIE
jgi:ABC-2 type transport system permease protein